MSNIFSVVTDSAKIVELNNILAEQLAKTFHEKESRYIAYPAGRFRADVYFEPGSSKEDSGLLVLTKTNYLTLY